MSPEIDAGKLKECVEKSGFLLEHRTYALLREFFNSGVFRQIRGDGEVGLVLHRAGNQPTEIDVFFDSQQILTDIVERSHTVVDQVGFANAIFRTLLVAECKGHPSDGFVLVQKLPYTSEYTQRIFYQRANNAWKDEKLDIRRIYMVSGGNFFRCKRKKGRSVDAYEMEREGSHNKFFLAYEQIMCNIRAIIDNLSSLPNAPTGAQVIRIAPLLVTNAPIVAMRVEDAKATFERVPWATHDARFQHFGQSDGKKRDFFDVFHVVTFDFLKQFMDRLFTSEASLFPQGDLRYDISDSDIPIL
jgi:hypothetical protein